MNNEVESVHRNSAINLGEMLGACWPRRWLIFICAVSCAGLALVLALLLPKDYTAWALLSPQTSQQGGLGAASGLLAQYAGLAGMAGLSISADKARAERLALLSSRIVVGAFIEHEHLLPILFHDKWNSKAKRWKRNVRQPTLYDGIQYFKKHVLTVVDQSGTGLVLIRIEWHDPHMAADWANGLVTEVNQYMRGKAIQRAKRHVVFLDARAQREHLISQQQAIARLMETELGREMLATGSEDYAFRILDPAQVPEKPSFPKPVLWTVFGLMLGGLISSVYVLVQVRRRS